MNRGLTILLVLSLAANVFLGGFVVGRHFGGPPDSGGPPRGGRHAMGPMFADLSALSPEEREAFHAVFKKKRSELRANFREVRQRRRAFSATLAADPWDRARAEEALEELSAVESSHQTAMAALLIDAFEGLSVENRKALVEAQASRRARWRGRRGDRRRPPPRFEDEESEVPTDNREM